MKELSKTLHRAFELRQKGDHMEEAEVTKKDVDEMYPKEPYIPFEMVKEKIYCGRKGEIEGFGLKVFP